MDAASEADVGRIAAADVEPARVVGDTLVLMEDAATNKGLRLRLQQRSPLPAVCLSDPLRLKWFNIAMGLLLAATLWPMLA